MAPMTVRRNGLALIILLARASFSSPIVRPFRSSATSTGSIGTEKGSPEFWYFIAISSFLVLAGGVFAGCVCCDKIRGRSHFMILISLTLGLMGLDELHLRVLATSSGDKFEKKSAQEGRGNSWHTRPISAD